METHHFFKAQPVHAGESVDSVKLIINQGFPDTPAEGGTTFLTEGARLAEVLIDTLPGGTLDALLIELMRNRASLFRVPFRRMEGTECL